MSTPKPFELESYEDASLKSGAMLIRACDLVGHTIRACIEHPSGAYAEPGSIVLVTETMCWAAIKVSGYDFEDAYCDFAQMTSIGGYRSDRPRRDLDIHDFLDAQELFSTGLINEGEHKLLREKEIAAKKAEKLQKAELLRKELADLEGGAQ